jgi:hypothetical protein
MGTNGQQLLVELPPGSGKVQIIGKNQDDKRATWQGNSQNNPGSNGNYGVFTSNWKKPKRAWNQKPSGRLRRQVFSMYIAGCFHT